MSTFVQSVLEHSDSTSPATCCLGPSKGNTGHQPLPSPLGNLSVMIIYWAMWQLYRIILLRGPCPFIHVLSFQKCFSLGIVIRPSSSIRPWHCHETFIKETFFLPPHVPLLLAPFGGFHSLWFLLLQLLRSRMVIFSLHLNTPHLSIATTCL